MVIKEYRKFKKGNNMLSIEDAAVSLFEHLKHSIGDRLRSAGRGKGIDHDEKTIVVEYKGDEDEAPPYWFGFTVKAVRFIRGG